MIHSDIVIVDDNPANLKLLEDMLLERGYEVRSFPLGRLALAAIVKNPPDLILLDINMPEMNGYEVCQRIRATPELANIPIVFLSALNDTQDKVKGFQSGGVDYISKPFQLEEVHARVETHLKLHKLQQALKVQNEHLEEAVAQRTRELVEANRRLAILDASKDDFLALISHEFRTPLHGLLGVAEIILDRMPSADQNGQLREIFQRSRSRILSILEDAMLLTEIDINGERFRVAPVPLYTVLSRAMEKLAKFANSRNVALPLPAVSPDLVLGDEDLLVRAFHALLETAVKFSATGETVRLSSDVLPDSRRLIIETCGEMIGVALLPKFFDIFGVRDSRASGGELGLGPPRRTAFSLYSALRLV